MKEGAATVYIEVGKPYLRQPFKKIEGLLAV
jgi:hypothetical protein